MFALNLGRIKDIDLRSLMRALPLKPGWSPINTPAQYITAFARAYGELAGIGINNPLRLAHFLAQGLIETDFLRAKRENFNYTTAERLMHVFPRKFPTPDSTRGYIRNPEALANYVYGDRADLGNRGIDSGDGWRYRGGGFFQLTGRDNYERYSEITGIDIASDPDLLGRDLKTSIIVAALYFAKTGLGTYADKNNAAAVSRGVNRGRADSRKQAHSEGVRIEWTERVIGFLSPSALEEARGLAPELPEDAPLDRGARGPRVVALQRNLNLLGFNAGLEDGVFGDKTRRAVLAFQDAYGLDVTGIVDDTTNKEIEDALSDTRYAQPIGRQNANANDLRRAGAEEIGAAQQTGTAGGVVTGAGAVVAANESGFTDSAIELGKEVVEDARNRRRDEDTQTGGADGEAADEDTATDSGEESSAADETPSSETATGSTEQPASPPAPIDQQSARDTDWTVVCLAIIVAVIGLFILMRSRRIVRTRVDAHRSGKQLYS